MRRRMIVDCESSSLTPDYHTGSGVIWELALADPDSGERHLWRVKPDASKASPEALQVGRFYERTRLMTERDKSVHDLAGRTRPGGCWSHPPLLAAQVARLLDGTTMIAANPAFDAGFIAAFLRCHGQAPTWSYRLRDFGSMAYGHLCAQREAGTYFGDIPPMDSSTDEFAAALGVSPSLYERHTAMGDCELVVAGLAVIEGRQP
jgi:hypothetical protein